MANKQINYINRDFNDFKLALQNFAKAYFPLNYNDFTDADPGTMFMEMASYVGDVLSFYQDTQINEVLPNYANEKPNLMALAYSRGYRPKVTNASSVDLDLFQLVPVSFNGVSYSPNFDYTLTIGSNTIVTSNLTGQTFLTQNLVNFGFSSSIDQTQVTVYQVDGSGNPVYYLLKKSTKAISGTIKSQDFSFDTPERFPTITLNDSNIIGILDVTDSDGNSWTEVPYLAQETVFDEIVNNDYRLPINHANRVDVPYLLRLKKVPRRFVTRFRADDLMELKFGSGVSSNSDEEIIPNSNNVGMGLSDGISKLNMAFDPSNFLYTKTYGLAPSNTTLTVRYLVGGGVTSNVPSNDITIIDKTNTTFNTNLPQIVMNTVVDSLAVNNPIAAVGGKDGDSIDDLRNNTISAFSTQLRAVTKDDYIVRSLSLPSKYGSVAKVYITQDSRDSSNPLSLSLYLLTFDSNKNLVPGSITFKENLKTYLSQFRMINDTLNIKDGYVVNIGVNFDIIVTPGNNNKEILLSCIAVVKDYFNIDKWQINQPIILSEIYNKISQTKGVQSVSKVEIVNKFGDVYSAFGYDIQGATRNGIIYPSLDPCIFELKFPDNDIMGRTVSF